MRGRGYLRSPADIGNTVVKATGGTPILVRNVAQVVEAYTPRRGAVARAGAIDSVEGTVLLRRGENPKEVLRGRARGGRRASTTRCCRPACASCRSTTAPAWSTRR